MSQSPTPNPIVRTLTMAVQHALEAGERDRGIPAARDVAQVLGLDGLDRALTVCRPGDPDTEPIARRLRDLCDRSITESTLEPWIEADAELGRLAVECGAVIEGEGGEIPEGTLTAAEALEEIPLLDDASRAIAERVRLTPQVSAALRAALDWLREGDSETRRVRLRTEDSALEVVCARVHVAGIAAAAKVLAAVGGNLGPVATTGRAAGQAAENGPWLMRVPIAAPRATYLMVTQNELKIALPWHAVLRVVMTPRAQFDASIRALGLPVLAPLVPLSRAPSEYPVVLLAHGLKRAYFVADRLIWRLPAQPSNPIPDPRTPGLDRAVIVEDGTVYRVGDPARLLEAVSPLTPSEPATARAREEVAEEPDQVRAASLPVSAALVEGEAPAAEASEAFESAGTALHAEEDLPELEPERVTPLALRALVAEDSFSARHALVRLLEEQQLEVVAVASAAELREALEQGPWDLVCVDAELPDGRGAELLREVREHARRVAPDADVVALVRDGLDEAAAIQAGVPRTLRKPWGRGAALRLFGDLGLLGEDA